MAKAPAKNTSKTAAVPRINIGISEKDRAGIAKGSLVSGRIPIDHGDRAPSVGEPERAGQADNAGTDHDVCGVNGRRSRVCHPGPQLQLPAGAYRLARFRVACRCAPRKTATRLSVGRIPPAMKGIMW